MSWESGDLLLSKFSVSLGVLNATTNFFLWLLTTLCAILSERIYRRISTYDCARHGFTRATDCTEISVLTWLFPEQRQRRHAPPFWVFILMALNVSLLPLEILSESGIDEFKNCYPKVVDSVGVCASPRKSRAVHACSSTSVLTQGFNWADKEWDMVLEGHSKLPNSQQVHRLDKLTSKNHVFLVKECRVSVSFCKKNCGYLTISPGSFAVQVRNWTNSDSISPTYGSVAHNPPLDVASLFWSAGSVPLPEPGFVNRSRIAINGLEMVLDIAEAAKVQGLEGELENPNRRQPATMKLNVVPSRTRFYTISCSTDGIPTNDFAKSVSTYRTSTLEAPFSTTLENAPRSLTSLPPLNQSDVAKAVYSFKVSDTESKCTGRIEVYTTCGIFRLAFVLPFVCLVILHILGWILLRFVLPEADSRVPVDAASWRHQAQQLMREKKDISCEITSGRVHFGMFSLDDEDCGFQPKRQFSEVADCKIRNLMSEADERKITSIRLLQIADLPGPDSRDDDHHVKIEELRK